MSLLVVSCHDSQLANDFANTLHVPFVKIKSGFFADTEIYVDSDASDLILDSDVLLVHQFFLNSPKTCVDSVSAGSINDQLIKFLLTCDLLKKMGAKKISAVLPYLAYSRQNKSFNEKYVGSIKLFSKFLKDAGVDRVFACDIHSESIFDIFDINLDEISLDLFWADYLKKNLLNYINNNKVCIASPDKGGISRANKIARILNLPVVCVTKKRVGPDNPVALFLAGDVNSKIVIIIDDIIDTCRTAIQASRLLKEHGAVKIIGVFTHAIFSLGNNGDISNSELDKVFISDAIPVSSEKLDNKILVCSINKYLIHNLVQKLS